MQPLVSPRDLSLPNYSCYHKTCKDIEMSAKDFVVIQPVKFGDTTKYAVIGKSWKVRVNSGSFELMKPHSDLFPELKE